MILVMGSPIPKTVHENNNLGISPKIIQLMETHLRRIIESCVTPILKSTSVEELEEKSNSILPLFAINRIKLAEILLKEVEYSVFLSFIRKSLQNASSLFIENLKKVPQKERVDEKIRIFISITRSILDIATNGNNGLKEDEILNLFGIETCVLLFLNALIEAENVYVEPIIHNKLAEIFCKSSREYRLKAEPYLKKAKKDTPLKERPVVKIKNLEKCPFPPELEAQHWEEEWSK